MLSDTDATHNKLLTCVLCTTYQRLNGLRTRAANVLYSRVRGQWVTCGSELLHGARSSHQHTTVAHSVPTRARTHTHIIFSTAVLHIILMCVCVLNWCALICSS
jgi:hypothetical protein